MPDTDEHSAPPQALDVIVIGAGIAGIYAVHKLRGLGFSVQALEAGDGVGGTWYWNRYPGCRVDIQSIEFSYSFSDDIQQSWDWSETMADQPELERYLNFVADRLDIRRHIQLNTRVTALTYDDSGACWTVRTEAGDEFAAQFVVCATGCLSEPLAPPIPGLETFAGQILYTSRFPAQGFDFTGKRVAVVGTGSSGVQAIPVIAEQAADLYVMQRSAAYTRPSPNRALAQPEWEQMKAGYADVRAQERASFAGTIYFPILPTPGSPPLTKRVVDSTPEERRQAIDELGWDAPWSWADVLENLEANAYAGEMYAELIRRVVVDPETAAALIPTYPVGCKRVIIENGYYQSFNRENVHLVDLKKGAITSIEPAGIQTEQDFFELDVLVFATGFDAMTGALTRMDITGRGGRTLREFWAAEGPVTYLGLQVEGFPNLFTVSGPGSPSVRSNMFQSIEQHVEFIAGALEYLRDKGCRVIEPRPGAADEWTSYAATLVNSTIMEADSCNSWFLGANIPGKKRVFMPYFGGLFSYRERCEDIVRADYEGFELSEPDAEGSTG
ncbi:NAD(P)/FAD-dependent oxidoreductase [Sporichthya sp.]|uniref:flavin-containing monooxygenase n=1 Tax=Sporichthya sp. TaxID=65475 RepID=UPI00185B9BB0|nr:NAD(P)/FAD-dependent oxidoreductase [Sporichthya sp.]MBA3741416.1 NAD(P)/FAD-dependent oxidoreductase [Sporichthya sp.]